MFSKDFKEFVELLIKNKVEYLIVGGYAVGIHGYPRYTGDLDIWLNPTHENAGKILISVNEFGFSSFKLTEEDFTKENNVVQLGYPPLRIDLLTQIDGVTFEECFKNRKEATIEESKIGYKMEDSLIILIRNIEPAQYIGHIFNDGFLDLYFYVQYPKKVDDFFRLHKDDKRLREFGWDMEDDPNWNKVAEYLQDK